MTIAREIRRRRPSRQLQVEPLEGRALMSAGLDQGFGKGGQVDGNFGDASIPGFSDAVAIQPDGRIVVLGQRSDATTGNGGLVLERFHADGSVDTTFGTGGSEVVYPGLTAPSTSGIGGVNDLLIQPDGKIVVAGVQSGSSALVRLNPDGSPDPSFGNGGIDVNSLTNVTVNALALQPDGKIILAGQANHSQFFAERIGPNGAPDPSFGTGGVITVAAPPNSNSTPTNGPISMVDAIAVQPDGKIVLAGRSYLPIQGMNFFPPGGATALRLDANGSLDTSFGQGGYVTAGDLGFTSVAIQADGKIDLTGSYSAGKGFSLITDQTVTQVDSGGAEDPSYNGSIDNFSGPDVGVSLPPNVTDASAIEPNGKLITVGRGLGGFQVARLTTGGNLDASFAAGHIVAYNSVPAGIFTATTDLPAATAEPAALAIQPDGKIVVASSGVSSTGQEVGFTLTRLDPGQIPGDYLGTGRSDAAIELPTLGAVAIRPSTGVSDILIPFGIAGAGQTLPAPGDYTGSGHAEIGVYLPGLGEFAYRPSDGGPDVLVPFGFAGAGQTIPAPADYAGTGRSDIAAYLPSLGEFAIRQPTGPDELVPFGIGGSGQSIPVPGDYEGTGRDDIAVYLPSIGAYAIRPATGGADEIIPFGIAGGGQSIPVPGDYDGSGKTEIAVYLPSLGEFAYRPANGGPDVLTPFGLAGAGQTLPMPGDYDGSGKTELAVYLPSLGDFAYRPSSGPDVIQGFGIPGRSIPFTTNPPSDTLPASLTGASVSAESVGWIDVVPAATKAKKTSADLPTLG